MSFDGPGQGEGEYDFGLWTESIQVPASLQPAKASIELRLDGEVTSAAHEVGLEPKLFGGGMVGLHFTALLTKLAQAGGWTVVGSDAYPTGSRDFSSTITKAKSGGAEVLVPVFDMPESGVLVKQAQSMKLGAVIAGFISPAAPATAWATFNGEIDGLVNRFPAASRALQARVCEPFGTSVVFHDVE